MRFEKLSAGRARKGQRSEVRAGMSVPGRASPVPARWRVANRGASSCPPSHAAGSLLISSSGRYSLSSETFSSSYFSHLGGSYWQRASFDAVIVLLSVFGVLAFLPRWQRIRLHHYIVGGVLLASVALFYLLLFNSLSHANDKLMPRLMELEQTGPR